MELSNKIKLLRNEKNLTQNELALALGVQRNTVTQYEAGRVTPPPQNLKKLAEIFSVSIDFLLDNQQNVQSNDIPSVQKISFGNSYMDSIFCITVQNIFEQFIGGDNFYIEQQEVIYKLIESLLFVNVKARKAKHSEIKIHLDNDNEKFEEINQKINEFAKQLASMEKMQKLMGEK